MTKFGGKIVPLVEAGELGDPLTEEGLLRRSRILAMHREKMLQVDILVSQLDMSRGEAMKCVNVAEIYSGIESVEEFSTTTEYIRDYVKKCADRPLYVKPEGMVVAIELPLLARGPVTVTDEVGETEPLISDVLGRVEALEASLASMAESLRLLTKLADVLASSLEVRYDSSDG